MSLLITAEKDTKMGESNLNNKEGYTQPKKKDDVKPVDTTYTRKYTRRERRLSKPFPYFLFIMFLGVLGIYIFYVNPTSNTDTTSPSTNIPTPKEVQEDIIIEFSDQDISFNCRAFDYYEAYRQVEWNGTIKIISHESEFDYINRPGGGLLIIPEFYVFVDDNYQMSSKYTDDQRCYSDGSLLYNLTISGKTISNSYYINVNDCDHYKNCGIEEHFRGILN